jgi:oxygen-independent coproporphyrinogen-3 oxidase
MSASTSTRGLGVYLHVPFCERVCPYCDFAVEAAGVLDRELAAEHVRLLLEELACARRVHGVELQDRRLESVYFGGGTPSLLPEREVAALLEGLVRAFGALPDEVTLEVNPGPLEVARLPGYRAAGVTRISVGVESLHDRTLKALGRAQSASETRRGLDACLAAGFASLSADLIYGAPAQRSDELFADLDVLVSAGVPHVSAYALTLEPGTPFAKAHAAGRLTLPDEDSAHAMATGVRARLGAWGYEQYEISSFARPGHRSRHNQRYWERRDVLGLGPSAASLLGRERLRNERGRAAWAEQLRAGDLPVAERETLPARAERQETLSLGLRRLEGVSRSAYLRRFGTRPEADFPNEFAQLRALGLVVDRAGRLLLSERGILFADEVFLRFVDAVDTPSQARLA